MKHFTNKFSVLFVTILMSVIALTYANAQETEPTIYEPIQFGENLEIEAKGSLNYLVQFPNRSVSMHPTDDFGYSVGLGLVSYWKPTFATRFALDFDRINTNRFSNTFSNYTNTFNPHIDFMWVIPSDQTIFEFMPFVGVGYAATSHVVNKKEVNVWKTPSAWVHSMTGNVGAKIAFVFSDWVDIAVQPELVFGNFSNLTSTESHRPMDMLAKVSVILSGRTMPKGENIHNTLKLYDYKEISNLQKEINELRKNNEELAKSLEAEKNKPAKEVIKEVASIMTPEKDFILFRVGKSELEESMKPIVEGFIKYAKETGKEVLITGYADKNTGSNAFNMNLSEARAKVVAEMFSNAGVDMKQVLVKYEGSTMQPYPVNNWNRAVTIEVVK